MGDLTEAQRKRAEARERRRGKSGAEPADQASDGAAAERPEGGGEQPLETVVHAAKIAAAGAAVGAAAAAARALTSHREEDEAVDAAPARHEELPAVEEAEPQEDSERSEPEAPRADEQQAEPQEEEQEPEEAEPEEREPVEGAALGDAQEVASRAREQLEALLGRPVETVSSLERTHDGWVVALEVVELSRVPESTDVLASYELELDENLDFRRYQQARRYTRSQADRGERS